MSKSDWNTLFKLGLALMLLVFALSVVGYLLGWFGSAGRVIKDEFGPEAVLEKYEWFIDQANYIEKADQDIVLFEQRLVDIETQYVSTYGDDKSSWSQSVLLQYNQELSTARTDLLAIISNRNALVREYNAQSEKFNWAPFQTRPDLPPRSYMVYEYSGG